MAEWRSIVGWEGFYEVSDDGRVKSLARTVEMVRRGSIVRVRYRERIMRTPLCEGYPKVVLSRPGHQERKFVHQLVCVAFHGPAPAGHEVGHNDGNRLNARAANLRWLTRVENIADMKLHGTARRGEQMPTSKLTEAQALHIINSAEKARVLAERFHVDPATISNIRTGKLWRYLHREAVAC